jgi:peptidoglycan-associated lipoprotein
MKVIKIVLSVFFIMMLAACASTGTDSNGVNHSAGSDEYGASSSGLGSGNNYAAQNGQMTQAQLLAKRVYYFDFDKTTVSSHDIPAIEAQAQYLVSHPSQIVLLTGNTDERGSREYNIGLGWRRAQSVASILTNNGVAQSQIKMVSYGAEKPSAMGHMEDDYSKNRRVELLYCNDANCQNVTENTNA